jgi:drug/metabolite transporter (DMT)-like permease
MDTSTAAPLGLWIAFFSGLAWAGLDIARKSLAQRHSPLVIATGLSLGSALLFALALLFGYPRIDFAAYLQPGLMSITLGICTQILILQSLRRSPLSSTIPMLSLTPVATTLFGVMILGERPATAEWIGILLVFLGALVLGVTRLDRRGPSGRRRLEFDRGAILMLLAAITISAAAPFDKLAVGASTTRVHGLITSLASALVLLCLLAVRAEIGQVAHVFRRRPAMVGAAALVFVALGLQFLAYRTAMVGEVETIKRVVGLVGSLVAGFLVFGERLTVAKIGAVVAMGAGTALILAGASP